jgi:hypothetical protein
MKCPTIANATQVDTSGNIDDLYKSFLRYVEGEHDQVSEA